MADRISKEQRSKNMKAIRSQSNLENLFTKLLWHRGVRFRKNVKKLKGNPDVAIQKYNLVIFIDSCFWHGCPTHYKRPKSNQQFWDNKIEKNRARDAEITSFYLEKNWNIKRIWEHDLTKNLDKTLNETILFINEAKKKCRL